jgi:hypothetical protein
MRAGPGTLDGVCTSAIAAEILHASRISQMARDLLLHFTIAVLLV